MLLYFSLSLFVSATLLFLVQPMIGKMILPQLGGTPAVWNTCMVFFQAVLLVGYGYTHLLTTTQPTRRQVLIQGILLLLPFLVLPFSLGDWTPPTESNPIFQLMLKLTIMVGLPFFMVSTTAPLLQKWFFHTGHPAAADPYFLYGASNFGSMLGLAVYPTVVEPLLQVTAPANNATWQTQVHMWTFGYAIFVGLVIGCAVIVWMALANKFGSVESPAPTEPAPAPAPATTAPATAITSAPKRSARLNAPAGTKEKSQPAAATTSTSKPLVSTENMTFFERLAWWWSGAEDAERIAASASAAEKPLSDHITPLRRVRWVGLAAAASSLMLGVTTYMTTDIAAVAFFWIIPLALYLLTFILVFARWPVVWTGTPHMIVMFVQPCVLLLLVLKMIGNLSLPAALGRYEMILVFGMHLAAFFATTLMCHGELAKDRPSTKHLTEFYFWMSLGGVLGGLFNALFAPIYFQYGIWEYAFAMAFACLLRSNLVDQTKTLIPGDSNSERNTPLGYVLDLIIPLAIGIGVYVVLTYRDTWKPGYFWTGKTYLLAAAVVAVLALSLRPLRFGFAVAALFLAHICYEQFNDSYLYEGRGFFGLLRVRESGWEKHPYPVIDEHGRETGDVAARDQKMSRTLIHGGINHGRQIVGYKNALGMETPVMTMKKRREPITYFHERNGVAELFYKLGWSAAQPVSALDDMNGMSDFRMPAAMFGLASGDFAIAGMLANTQSEPPFAVLGLGTGILGCYAKPFQHVDIYEIDPLVKNLSVVEGYVPPWHENRAKMRKNLPDPTFFFVQDAQERGARVEIILGDGRLMLKNAPEKYYHIIALDAFSSDAIPVHLLTKDAVDLYLTKLVDGGVLLFNTTNRYVRIERVLARIAEECDCDCLYCPDYTYETDHPDRFSADWIVLQPRSKSGTYNNGGLPIRLRLEQERIRRAWNGQVVTVKDQENKLFMLATSVFGLGATPMQPALVTGASPYPGRGNEKIEPRWREVDPLPGRVWTDGYSNMLNSDVMPWLAPWRRRGE